MSHCRDVKDLLVEVKGNFDGFKKREYGGH